MVCGCGGGRGCVRRWGGVLSDGDHRIAMSMAVLNTFADGPLRLGDVGCVDTSYPGFWSDMVGLGGRVER